MGGARAAALTALERCRRSGAWSDAVLGGVMDAAELNRRDRALASALCYGVLQNRALLDAALAGYSARPLNKAEPKVLDILRISAFQILFLDRVPASAAVNEGVALCRALGYGRAAGYVNAVLRKLAATPVLPDLHGLPENERLSVRYSHPLWLVDALLAELGAEETEAFLRCNNAPAPLTMQVNTTRTDTSGLAAALSRDGVQTAAHPFLPDCLTAERAGEIGKTAAFREGLFYVQDAAAKCAVLAAAPQPGQRILDACAAPGGKSFAAAILTGDRAEITACDLHEKKLSRVCAGAERMGLRSIQTTQADAGENRAEWNGGFDLVLADAPCSGLGVIRKKPDIRYRDADALTGLPEAQYRILRNCARYVAPGGTLLYATCTVLSAENGGVVRRFLAETDDFAPEDFTYPAAAPCGSTDGMVTLWPQRGGTDGFFIAKLRKHA
ncbi:MAG: 16S rRNA (cytosine(967)-C(5))-methyltransferase RsmB [Oscillospiraceae bacterium]|nr:16S rRNA (cytosine(967)-C(5))-methyltransferase RsmB [Oscillospiraceae bacterium]